MAITNLDAVRIVDEHRGDAVIVTTMNSGNPNFGLPEVTTHEEMDFTLTGCMGKASSLGLGIALAKPERKVIVLDGDGSLLMNLGTLVTISNKAPENLYHFVFENGMYAVTGGQPVPGEGTTSFQGMAEQAGYTAAYQIDDTEELATRIDSILQQNGPVLVCLGIVPQIDDTPAHIRRVRKRTVHMAIEDLTRVFGRE